MSSALGLLGKRSCLVDFNFTTSHLTLVAGLSPSVTFNDVLKNEADIKSAMYPCYNTFFIPASLSLSELENLEISDLKSRLMSLLGDFDYVILDSAPSFGKEALSAIQASDELIYVTTPTISSITDIIKCEQLATSLGVTPLGIVVNKYRKKNFELRPIEISRITELPILAVIKDDTDFLKSEAMRVPFVLYKKSKAGELMNIASMISGVEYKKPGFLDSLASRFGLR